MASKEPHKTNQTFSTSTMTITAVMTAITCILAPLSLPLPMSPVPLSPATFIILLSAFILGWRLAGISCLLYLLLGIAGLPVFSAYGSGIGKVLGPTGGYLLGYLPLAILGGLVFEYFKGKIRQIIILAAATALVLYLPGTAWLAYQAGLSLNKAFLMGVIPYIPGDLLKIIIVVFIGPRILGSLKRAGIM